MSICVSVFFYTLKYFHYWRRKIQKGQDTNKKSPENNRIHHTLPKACKSIRKSMKGGEECLVKLGAYRSVTTGM